MDQFVSMSLFDRIHGCLLGGACGDALGAPVEFMAHEEIVARYGPCGITQFDTAYGGIGLVTDDTQMTLFTVEGLIRDAPFGFFRFDDPSQAFEWAVESAWTTHGHPSARYSSGALAAIVAYIAKGKDLSNAISRALVMLPGDGEAGEVSDALGRAVDLSRTPDWQKRLPELGKGWVAEEALAISVLCALAGTNAREAIVAAVNHSGDSDSTGAITGNIVGAINGANAFPAEWIDRVELRDVIETLSRDFAAILEERQDGEGLAQRLWDRYPGW